MERRQKMYEVWEKQSLGIGLQDSIESKDISIHWQCKPGTSPEEKEVRQRTPQDYGAGLRGGFGK